MRLARSALKSPPAVRHRYSPKYRLPDRCTRTKVATYNLVVLAGTAIHTPKKFRNKHSKLGTRGNAKPVVQREHSTSLTNITRTVRAEQTDYDDQAEAQLLAEAAHAAQRKKT
jgi:palmitoyltransferase ZDHHC9/14/18